MQEIHNNGTVTIQISFATTTETDKGAIRALISTRRFVTVHGNYVLSLPRNEVQPGAVVP